MTKNGYEITNEALTAALKAKKHNVITLTGKWGSGKTELWKTVSTKIAQNEQAKPLYISIFGAKTLSELKLRVLQDAASINDNTYKDFIKLGGSILKGVAGKFIPGLASEELILLSLPKLLKNRLVVIDDIERKHKSLELDEVLGFINEYAEQHKTRFLLLLSSENLKDSETWKALHEKVIDLEISLNPSAKEAFDIAARDFEEPHIEDAKAIIEKLNITNIRVIKKTLTALETLLHPHFPLAPATIQKTYPSTLLLTAIHYRGISSGISHDYILKHNRLKKLISGGSSTPPEAEWDALLEKVGISSTDAYQTTVIDYLNTGITNRAAIEDYIKSQLNDEEARHTHKEMQHFFELYYWTPCLDQQELVHLSEFFIENVSHLNASEVSAIAKVLTEIDEAALESRLVQAWINQNEPRIKVSISDRLDNTLVDHGSTDTLHPAIRRLYDHTRAAQHLPLSLEDAIQNTFVNNGWGGREIQCLGHASPEDFIATIKSLSGRRLEYFFEGVFSLLNTGGLSKEFEAGLESFREACRRIMQAEGNSRLALIIGRILSSRNINISPNTHPNFS
ncbi:hypothetical protein JYG34_15015 [Pseudomonas entomophila]|uniref:P-loop NTPase fold protein n=1 Tax=Pseudomonas entomophila TaxID=312306 RepID=UPI001BCB2AD6|nr:P-loop NTPase fold protein [Pseudomonas entomophila]QVM89341.1 hypothetical protein JYG34_15015 [Pseudomonas entomophila]